jgi:diguanylate cyclase (GGDEF)-like protein
LVAEETILFRRIVTRGAPGRGAGIAFELLLATAGWLAIGEALIAMPSHGWSPIAGALLFLSVSAGARLFAFPLSGLVSGLPPSTMLSLDAAVIVSGALAVGAPPIAAGLAVILGIDTAARAIVRRRGGSADGDAAQSTASIVREALYAGGVAGGLLVGSASVFGETFRSVLMHLWLVPAFGIAFLATHAAVQVLHDVLFGLPLRPSARKALIALAAEGTLLPLGAVMMLIWAAHRPIAFAMLGVTYLLVNFGFFRVARITVALRRRVRELNTLQRTSQAMAAELEVPRIVTALLRELHRALPAAHLIELRLSPQEGVVERFALEHGRTRVKSSTVPANEWDRSHELAIEDHLDAPLGATRSRVLAPLKMYGESLGVLVVDSQKASVFGEHEARLIEAIASQAASTLENARLHALANFDGLTGLYCRRYFDTRLVEEIERARRFETNFCVVLLDIDNFKKLNDSRGHLAGDRALREVARIAQAQLRNVDLAARYGGEELVFLLPRTTLTDAQVVAERIRDAVGSHIFGENAHITVSIGVAAFSDTGADVQLCASNVLGRADISLYRAKTLGKDRVEVDLGPIELSPSLAPINRRRRA